MEDKQSHILAHKNKVIATLIIRPTLVYAVLLCVRYMMTAVVLWIGLSILQWHFPSLSLLLGYMKVVVGLPLTVMLYQFAYWRLVRYEVSADQIKYKRGVFNLREDYLELYRVKDFEKHQPIVLRLFGMMNFTVLTSDKSHPILVLRGIPDSNLPDIIRDLVQLSRVKNRVLEVD